MAWPWQAAQLPEGLLSRFPSQLSMMGPQKRGRGLEKEAHQGTDDSSKPCWAALEIQELAEGLLEGRPRETRGLEEQHERHPPRGIGGGWTVGWLSFLLLVTQWSCGRGVRFS